MFALFVNIECTLGQSTTGTGFVTIHPFYLFDT